MTTNEAKPTSVLIVSAESGEALLTTTEPEDSSGLEFNMDAVVDEMTKQGVAAYVEQTGGGCATIQAGATHLISEDGYCEARFSAVAGPGTFGWGQGPSIGHTDEFYIGPDNGDGLLGIGCDDLEITSARDLADLIIAQARLPFGKSITRRQARRILRRTPGCPLQRALIAVLGLLSSRAERGKKIRADQHATTCWCQPIETPAARKHEGAAL